MRKSFYTSRLIILGGFFICVGALSAQPLPYQNASLSVADRVKDLLGRMTLKEKIAQVKHTHSWELLSGQVLDPVKLKKTCDSTAWGFVEGFPLTGQSSKVYFHDVQEYMMTKTRLKIPIFTVAESLHGAVNEGATIFPQNIALGATFNPELARKKAGLTSDDLHYIGVNQVLAPCIDVVREPRWGRNEESYGEDPLLCGRMAVAEVKGYMSKGISPMLKHYGPHGAPLGGINLASVDCGTRDLREVFLKPFEMVCKETSIQAVMSSYNSWNRIPNSASKFLQTDILRGEFGFKGYVYSDWGVLNMLKKFHNTANSDEEAARMAMVSGLDVEASSNTFPSLIPLIERGEFDVAYLDTAVARVLAAKMRLGLFEDPYGSRFDATHFHSKASVALAKEIADESVILMKNEGNLLPLDVTKYKQIAVIGPNANQAQFGDYTWGKDNNDGVNPLKGIQNWVGKKAKVVYAQGCSLSSLDTFGFAEAVQTAKVSDIALVFVGTSSTAFVRSNKRVATSGEGIDLHDISLTGKQEELIKAIHKVGKPIVVVFVTGKPIAAPWVKAHIPAILTQFYGGEEAGNSIVDILFGAVNPSGKLNFSFPQSTGHLPCYYNYLTTDKGYYKVPGSYDKPGRDYVFASPDPLWAFGHGLSYTQFEYVSATTDRQKYGLRDTIKVHVVVKNTGKRAGKEVVQVYVRDMISSIMTPVKQLRAFEKKEIQTGETISYDLNVPVQDLYLTDDYGKRFVEPGVFEIQVAAASDDVKHKIYVGVGEYKETAGRSVEQDLKRYSGGSLITVTGVVRDVQAYLMEGVLVTNAAGTVLVKTGADGTYTIRVGELDALVFTKEGFQKHIVPVEGQKNINLRMNKE